MVEATIAHDGNGGGEAGRTVGSAATGSRAVASGASDPDSAWLGPEPWGLGQWASLARDITVLTLFLLAIALPWESWLGGRAELARMGEGPTWGHPLGFDNLGRDLLARIAGAIRGAVLPLWAAVGAGAIVGVALAVGASVAASRAAESSGAQPLQAQPILSRAQRLILARATSGLDILLAIICGLPVGVVAFAWAAYREEASLTAVVASLAPLAAALAYLRVRDLARRDAGLAYWEAHRAAGGKFASRFLRYGLFADWRAPLLGQLGHLLRVAVAVEAALSYLGFGVQEPAASFGNMLASHFEQYLRGDFRVLAVVAAALALTAAFPASCIRVANACYDRAYDPRSSRAPHQSRPRSSARLV